MYMYRMSHVCTHCSPVPPVECGSCLKLSGTSTSWLCLQSCMYETESAHCIDIALKIHLLISRERYGLSLRVCWPEREKKHSGAFVLIVS